MVLWYLPTIHLIIEDSNIIILSCLSKLHFFLTRASSKRWCQKVKTSARRAPTTPPGGDGLLSLCVLMAGGGHTAPFSSRRRCSRRCGDFDAAAAPDLRWRPRHWGDVSNPNRGHKTARRRWWQQWSKKYLLLGRSTISTMSCTWVSKSKKCKCDSMGANTHEFVKKVDERR